MAEPSAIPVVDEVLRQEGIKPWSIIGGARLQSILFKAIELDRAQRVPADSPGELLFTADDWAFDIPEDASDDAWWIDLQLFDHEDEDPMVRHVVAVLTLSDVELAALWAAAGEAIIEGRKRFA